MRGAASTPVVQCAGYADYAWRSPKDWYGSRCTCLTCGTGWMEGEYRKCPKREVVKTVTDAKRRIKHYIATGFEQGYRQFFARLEFERALRMISSGRLLTTSIMQF